jgi:hypothetical protein
MHKFAPLPLRALAVIALAGSMRYGRGQNGPVAVIKSLKIPQVNENWQKCERQ